MGEALILVRKLDYQGKETWRWHGRLMERSGGTVVIDAIFNGSPRDLGYMKLESNDLFHEFYYADRWFNVFQVSGGEGTLKGWYCNICRPPSIAADEISFVDMVLDVFVYPDGRTLVLDEEDFRLNRDGIYSPADTRLAEEAVSNLLEMVRRRDPPFEIAAEPSST